jgi:pectate lyase
VVELNTMIDLSRHGRPNNGSPAIAHPDLFAAGRTTGTVGTLSLGSNKTIYSAYGNGGFRRGTLFVDGRSNVALRNLKFRELWEWDDATQGQYDRNGWDYIVLQSNAGPGTSIAARAHHLWIDHCDFEKAYDGTVDIVHGADLVTVSWCKFGGAGSGESVRWLRRQLEYLEANRSRFSYYNALRANWTVDQIFARETFQQKSNLVGNSTDATTRAHDLGHLNVTFHHNWYLHVDQRMPRMRYGNAHVFNLFADSSAGRGVIGLSLAGVAATSGAAVRLENSTFIEVELPVNNRIGTEPAGYITVLGSANLEGATGRDRGFDALRTVPPAEWKWNEPAAASGLGAWPQADPAAMPAGYVPAGATLAEYIDDRSTLRDNLAQVGIIMPADEGEAGLLRSRWQAATAPR